MKKTILIIIVAIAGQLFSVCHAQQLTKQPVCVYSSEYNNDSESHYYSITIHFDIDHLSYDCNKYDNLSLKFQYDTITKKMTVNQYPYNSSNLDLTGQYILKDNNRMDTVFWIRPFEPYEELDTIVHLYDAIKDGNWEYYDTSGKVIKKVIYTKGKIDKTFVPNEKGEMIEVKK
jgi:hypothetical protein